MAEFTETGSISAAGATCAPVRLAGAYNLTISGAFAASAVWERSFDGGTTWYPLTYPDGTPLILSGPCSLAFEESRMAVIGRMRSLSWTAGEMNWRVSRGV
jgi:hypothetical protein